jgi:hypothetical protein
VILPVYILRPDCHSTLSRAIQENLQSVQTSIADLKVDTSTIVDTTSEIKHDTTVLRDDAAVRHKHDLMTWICSIDYHVQHQDFINRHQTGTGQWFLQDTIFQGWDRSNDATLFCPGIPGASVGGYKSSEARLEKGDFVSASMKRSKSMRREAKIS